jgi:hypothetical protein
MDRMRLGPYPLDTLPSEWVLSFDRIWTAVGG